MTKEALRKTFLDTLPVLAGYLFLGCGFGILLSQNGYGLGWALAMSLFIYAGSGQYLAVELLAGGAALITTAMATLLVNARHLFYGISLLDTYQDTGKAKPYLIFALTDETYSLVTQAQPPEGVSRKNTACWSPSWINATGWWAAVWVLLSAPMYPSALKGCLLSSLPYLSPCLWSSGCPTRSIFRPLWG